MLFADVKGSMELAEQLDPEAWHRILERFFAILTDGVHRFEGTVNQYTGDGIMALFGAPIAHEDHAQRACYAALHLRDEIARYATEVKREHGVGFSTRMGLNSGEVVVGRIGDDLRMDYTAQGHTVGLAQRMESLAEPNTCYLTAATARWWAGYFALEDLGEFQVKGVAAPVRVHRLAGLGALAHALRRRAGPRAVALRRARPRICARSKMRSSRPRRATARWWAWWPRRAPARAACASSSSNAAAPAACASIEGRAVAHGRNIPFLPILELFRAYFGITDGDDDRSAREKIAGRMVLLDQSNAAALPLLFDFLGVADPHARHRALDPEARQRQLIGLMRQVIQSVSDDAAGGHDDRGSALARRRERGVPRAHGRRAMPARRSLLLVNFRPEYHAEWMQKSWYRQIPLTPLGREAIAELLADLLGNDPSLAGLAGADPRAHRRQPVLHRGGGAVADRVGASRRHPRRLPAGDADRAARGAGDRAGGAGGAHRSAAGAREAAAASRRR